MPVIDITTQISAPIERVVDLSRSVDLHTASTAQTGERAVAGVTKGLMSLGQEVTWRARHFGIWQRLTAGSPPSILQLTFAIPSCAALFVASITIISSRNGAKLR